MKKTIRLLLVALVVVLLGVGFKANAQSDKVTAIEGASIRLEGKQGLRFYAELDESVKTNEHGFYLIYGLTTVNELKDALLNNNDINDKEIFKVNVPGVTNENRFTVVLTDIPSSGYYQNITVVPYVVVDEEEVFSNAVTRSVAAVALNMANDGKDIDGIADVEGMLNTPLKKYKLNSSGYYEISSGVYETHHANLKKEFVRDWNTKFGTNFTNLEAEAFYNSAKEGTDDLEQNSGSIKDISNLNIYKFFNDNKYEDKWGWFLDYLLEGDSTTHGGRQIEAIQGEGTYNDNLLYNGEHLSYSIYNFFNQSNAKGFYTANNFTQLDKYDTVKDFNDKIYIDATTYEFYNVGDEIKTPEAISKNGYTFEGYKVGEETISANTIYNVNEDVIVKPILNVINYIVEFYDGEQLVESKTYTIEKGLRFDEFNKEGYLFDGWYLNPDLEGNPVTAILEGNTGDLTYYAKFIEGFTVTYDLGEHGNTSNKTKSGLFEDFMDDFAVVFVRSRGQADNFYTWSYWTVSKDIDAILDSGEYGVKYNWIKQYLLNVAEETEYGELEKLQTNHLGAWRINIHAFFNETVHEHGGIRSIDFTDNDELNNGFWPYTGFTRVTLKAIPGGSLYDSSLINVCCEDHSFAGWYDNPEYSGDPLTMLPEEINSNITLYAKWDFNPTITYDYGKYGYISSKTKEELFEEFAEDYIEALVRNKTVEEMLEDFFVHSGLPTETDPEPDYNAYGDITKIFRYDDNKWAWLQQFILDLAEETNYKNRQALIDGNQGTWRSNFEAFFTNIEFIRLDFEYTRSIDFSNLNNANAFWTYAPFAETKKIEEFDNASPIFDGTTISSWNKDYVFDGWYDNPSFTGSPLNELPESVNASLVLYAKWQGNITITYDLGEYGYIHDKTKQELFEDFAVDYRKFNGLDSSVDVLGNFNTASYQKQTFGFFNDSVYGQKWGWFKQYLEELKIKTGYAGDLSTEAVFRSNLHHFFLETSEGEMPTNWLKPMDFYKPELANGFWEYEPNVEKSKVIDYVVEEVILDGSTITSWHEGYEFEGWYTDKALTNKVTSLPEVVESSMILYAKWQEK